MMGKSSYSLILSDEVVRAVDALAYQNNTNRSNMINQILADAVSYQTPEKRMQEIFARMEAVLLDHDFGHSPFQLQGLPTDTLFSLRSAIEYKYNPSVRYSVELYRQMKDGAIGELRVGLRTQNKKLLAELDRFYSLWNAVETHYFPETAASAENGKYSRLLRLRVPKDPETDISELTVGDVISRYINTFDKALKAYFSSDTSEEELLASIDRIYQDYRKEEVYV